MIGAADVYSSAMRTAAMELIADEIAVSGGTRLGEEVANRLPRLDRGSDRNRRDTLGQRSSLRRPFGEDGQ